MFTKYSSLFRLDVDDELNGFIRRDEQRTLNIYRYQNEKLERDGLNEDKNIAASYFYQNTI